MNMKQKMNNFCIQLILTFLFLGNLLLIPTTKASTLNLPPSSKSTYQKDKFHPTEFIQQLEDFITKEANLTTEEAQAFFPKFHEMKKKQREIQKKIKRCSRRIEKEQLSEEECNAILNEITNFNKQEAEIQSKAYQEWKKILSSSKILKVLNADHKFGKQVFRKMTRSKK